MVTHHWAGGHEDASAGRSANRSAERRRRMVQPAPVELPLSSVAVRWAEGLQGCLERRRVSVPAFWGNQLEPGCLGRRHDLASTVDHWNEPKIVSEEQHRLLRDQRPQFKPGNRAKDVNAAPKSFRLADHNETVQAVDDRIPVVPATVAEHGVVRTTWTPAGRSPVILSTHRAQLGVFTLRGAALM